MCYNNKKKTQKKTNLYSVNGLKLNKKVVRTRKSQIDQLLACASNYNLQTASSIIISILSNNPALKKIVLSNIKHKEGKSTGNCSKKTSSIEPPSLLQEQNVTEHNINKSNQNQTEPLPPQSQTPTSLEQNLTPPQALEFPSCDSPRPSTPEPYLTEPQQNETEPPSQTTPPSPNLVPSDVEMEAIQSSLVTVCKKEITNQRQQL